MSGHSKWHNIRLRKGAQDAKRGNLFTKLAKEIILAARDGGGNPDRNLRLRLAVQKARDNSMPQDNIKRSIQRGTGEVEGAVFEELTYEGYGPGGTAVIVGVPSQGTEISVPVNPMVHLDRRIMGVRYGESRPRHDIPLIVGLYQQHRFKLDEMVTRTYPLEDWEQAMHDMHAGELARGVLLF